MPRVAKNTNSLNLADDIERQALKDQLDDTGVVDLEIRDPLGGNVKSQVISSSKHTVLWQPIGDPKKKLYRPSVVQRANVYQDYLNKPGMDGKRAFYLRSELPDGWQAESLAAKFKYKCVVCGKKYTEVLHVADGRGGSNDVHGLIMLMIHMKANHRNSAQFHMPAIEAMVDKLGLRSPENTSGIEIQENE